VVASGGLQSLSWRSAQGRLPPVARVRCRAVRSDCPVSGTLVCLCLPSARSRPIAAGGGLLSERQVYFGTSPEPAGKSEMATAVVSGGRLTVSTISALNGCIRWSRTGAAGTVEMWRGDSRFGLSVSAPFVWRCPSTLAVAPFPHSDHRERFIAGQVTARESLAHRAVEVRQIGPAQVSVRHGPPDGRGRGDEGSSDQQDVGQCQSASAGWAPTRDTRSAASIVATRSSTTAAPCRSFRMAIMTLCSRETSA